MSVKLTADGLIERSQVLIASPKESLESVLKKMTTAKVGSIIIVENSKIKGIFTERDFLNHWQRFSDKDAYRRPIEEFMTHPVLSLKVDEISKSGTTMMQKYIRHVPIVDEGGGLMGVISARDVLNAYIRREEKVLAQRQKRKDLSTQAHKTMHLITPTLGLQMTCEGILHEDWKISIWPEIDVFFHSSDIEKATQNSAFFLDLDGLSQHDWKKLLREFIEFLKKPIQPRVFIVYTPTLMEDADLKAVQKIVHTAHWRAYERPIALGVLSEELKDLFL